LRSEGIHFKNKYNFTILKRTTMPQIKEAIVGSQLKYKICITFQYPFGFCSDVSFIGTIFSRNWHLLFVFTLLTSDLTFVFLLLALLVTNWYLFILIFRRSFFVSKVKTTSHKYVLPNIKHIWRNN